MTKKTRVSAFSEEEKSEIMTKKSRSKAIASSSITESSHSDDTRNSGAVRKTAKPDGIHAVRGMSLQINEMLAMGCFTPDDIVRCILPNTRDGSEKQAVTKLRTHLQNMKNHGAVIRVMEGDCICCADVVLPELPD